MPAFFPALPHALDADLRVVRADNPLANSITKLFGGHYDFIDGSRVENVIQGDRRIPVRISASKCRSNASHAFSRTFGLSTSPCLTAHSSRL